MPRVHEAVGSIPSTTKEQNKLPKKKLALKKFPLAVYKKRGLVYRGDFTPKDSGQKPATIGAVAVSVCYCVSLDKVGFYHWTMD